MKTYKLIKEYPGINCEEGTEATASGDYYKVLSRNGVYKYIGKEAVETFPDIWEPVNDYIECNYDITLFRHYSGIMEIPQPHNIESLKKHWEIAQVKRLTDGHIFSIEDYINTSPGVIARITKMTVDDKALGGLMLDTSNGSRVSIFAAKPIDPFKDFTVLKSEGGIITEVIRDYDQQVFKVGQKVIRNTIDGVENPCTTSRIIKKIFLNNHSNFKFIADTCHSEDDFVLGLFDPAPTPVPLFTTEDGKDIFEGDYWWYVAEGSSVPKKTNTLNYKGSNKKPVKRFSSEAAAENYILLNHPCLSISDVLTVFKEHPTLSKLSFAVVLNALSKKVKNN